MARKGGGETRRGGTEEAREQKEIDSGGAKERREGEKRKTRSSKRGRKDVEERRNRGAYLHTDVSEGWPGTIQFHFDELGGVVPARDLHRACGGCCTAHTHIHTRKETRQTRAHTHNQGGT